jgi:hypothetical protein
MSAPSSHAAKTTRKTPKKTKETSAPIEKVQTLGITKDEAYVYFVDRRGNLLRMERGVAKATCEVVLEKAVRREKGFMYYLDDDGDLVREPDSSRDG